MAQEYISNKYRIIITEEFLINCGENFLNWHTGADRVRAALNIFDVTFIDKTDYGRIYLFDINDNTNINEILTKSILQYGPGITLS